MSERVIIEHPCQNPPRREMEDVKMVIWKLGDPDMNWEDMNQWECSPDGGPCKKFILTYEQAEKFYGEGSCHLEHYTPLRLVK